MNISEQVVAFIVGFFTNAVSGLWLFYRQFESSTAGHRVDMVVKATQGVINAREKKLDMTVVRNRYRYALGVIIDELVGAFGTKEGGFEENGPWPCLVDQDWETRSKDRWSRFDERIRPVIVDINSYSFIGIVWFRLLCVFPKIRRLYALMELCKQLEAVVRELDASLEVDLVCISEGKIIPNTNSVQEVEPLRCEYRRLYEAWRKWLCLVPMAV